MRFLDGELTPADVASLRLHLSACPGCCGKLHQFAGVTATFSGDAVASALETMDSSSTASASSLVGAFVPTHTWDSSGIQLRNAAAWLSRGFALLPRSAVAGIAVMLMGALLAHFLISPPRVSARGLVDTAWRKQRERQSASPARTMQRVLRVTREAKGQPPRTEHWSSMISSSTSHEELIEGQNAAEEILSGLPNASCRTFVPLSLDMLDCLLEKESQTAEVEEVSQGTSVRGYRIALATTALNRVPLRSKWTIEQADWRLRSVEFELGSAANRVRILVEEQEVRAYRAAPAEASASASTRASSRSSSSAIVPPQRLAALRDISPASDRLLAFEAIASFQPTLEEDLRVRNLPGGRVRIEGIVQLADRQAELKASLVSAPEIEFAVRTQEEAIAMALADTAKSGLAASAPNRSHPEPAAVGNEMRGEGPMLTAELEEYFGSDDNGKSDQLRFTEQVSNAAQNLAFHARWLRRLQSAFPDAERRHFREAEMQRLNRLRDRWFQSVSQLHRQLQTIVRPVLCASGCDAGKRGEDAETRTDDAPSSLSFEGALQAELALLKTMFVDRAYLPLDSATGAKARWVLANSAVIEAMERSSAMGGDLSLSVATVPQSPAASGTAVPRLLRESRPGPR